MNELGSIKKEYLQQAGFRLLLDRALESYPQPKSFNVNDATEHGSQIQIEQWKAKSSEQAGFDLCFKLLTGYYPKDYRND